MKILLTFGGTREYVDAARFITNMSTGGTGRAIAEYLSRRGHKVVCLCSEGSLRPRTRRMEIIEFSGFRDLDSKMRALLGRRTFDAVIHPAAVSDYSPAAIKLGTKKLRAGRGKKLDSGAGTMTIVLKKNFRILDRIRDYALRSRKPYKPLVIGFKLTSAASKTGILRRVKALKAADYVVHNDLREINRAGKKHPFHIYRNGVKFRDCAGAAALAKELHRIITEATYATSP